MNGITFVWFFFFKHSHLFKQSRNSISSSHDTQHEMGFFFDGYLLEVLEDVRSLAENTEMLIFFIVLLVFNRSKVKGLEFWPLLSGQVLEHFKSLSSFFMIASGNCLSLILPSIFHNC